MPLSRTLKRGYKTLTLPVHPLGNLANTIGDDVQSLSPTVNMLADQVLDNPAVTEAAQGVGGQLGQMLGQGAGSALESAAGALQSFAPAAGGETGAALGGTIGESASDALTALASAIPYIGPVAGPATKAVTGWMTPAGAAAGGLAGSALGQGAATGLSLLGKVAPFAGEALGKAGAIPAVKLANRAFGTVLSHGLHDVGSVLGAGDDSPRTGRAMNQMTAAMNTPMAGMSSFGQAMGGLAGSMSPPAGFVGWQPQQPILPGDEMGVSPPTHPDWSPDQHQEMREAHNEMSPANELREGEQPRAQDISMHVSETGMPKPQRTPGGAPPEDMGYLARALSGSKPTAAGTVEEAELRRRLAGGGGAGGAYRGY